MAVADISGAFSMLSLGEPHYVKRPVEFSKPGIVWRVKRYLHGDKRAPWWPDHFEATTQNLIFVRWASEPGSFVKKGATPKDTTIGIVHVDDLLSVGKRKNLDNSFLQLAGTQKLKRVEHMEIGKSVLFFWVATSRGTRTGSLSRARDAQVDNMPSMLSMEGCKPTDTPMVRKENPQQTVTRSCLERSEGETYRSVVGILMFFKRHRFELHDLAKSPSSASSSPARGHMRRLK